MGCGGALPDPKTANLALCQSPAGNPDLAILSEQYLKAANGLQYSALDLADDRVPADAYGEITRHEELPQSQTPAKCGARALGTTWPRDKCYIVEVTIRNLGGSGQNVATFSFETFICVYHVDNPQQRAARICKAACVGPDQLWC